MSEARPIRLTLALLILITLAHLGHSSPVQANGTQWPQWGGPGRDFSLAIAPTMARWEELGPRLLWSRELGPGYSGLVADGPRLITMTRRGDQEVVLAMDRDNGSTVWEHTYSAPVSKLQNVDISYGDAPQATPLLVAGRIYTLGFTGVLSCLDAASGEPCWQHDLGKQHQVSIPYFGHAASPIQVGNNVIVAAGGAMAFDLESGELQWQNRDFGASYASPILVSGPAGQQLVIAGAGEVVGLKPDDGKLLWRQEHANQHRTHLSTPVVGKDNVIFASAYFLGSLGLRLDEQGQPTKLWQQPDLQISHSNTLGLGDMVVASHNRLLVGLDLSSGEVLWRHRGLRRANLLRLGDQVMVLDEQGKLAIGRVDRQGFHQRSIFQFLHGRSWTPPTLVGNRLYGRSAEGVVAVDLAQAAQEPAQSAAHIDALRANQQVVSAPAEFTKAADALQLAALQRQPRGLKQGFDNMQTWVEHEELAPYARYYRGFAAWMLATVVDESESLAEVDRAVEELREALRLQPRLAEAHALLGNLYPMYYRLAPRRAAVVGPLGDEHLDNAMRLDPQNPRVIALQAVDLVNSPLRYGGNPELGRERLNDAIERLDREQHHAQSPAPRWGKTLARLWQAQALIRVAREDSQEASQKAASNSVDAASTAGNTYEEQAIQLLQQVLAMAPEHPGAQRLLATLGHGAGAS